MPLCQCNTGLFSNVNYENSPWDLKVGPSLVFLHQTLKFHKKLPVSVTAMQIQGWL